MNVEFAARIQRIPGLFVDLVAREPAPMDAGAHPNHPGIYILYEAGVPVHVGRTRKLRRRLQAHCTPQHNSASFAFKRARRELGVHASYRAANSRAALQADDIFGPCFRRHVDAVRSMQVRFLSVPDPIDQYFLELYAVMELGLPQDEFDTH